MIIRNKFIYAAAVALFLFSACGGSIKTAQDFIPNKAPILDDAVSITDAKGSTVDTTRLTIGSAYKISVRAQDPEEAPLIYSFTSEYGSFSEQTEHSGGCSVLFTVKSVISGEPVHVRLAVMDIKKATVTANINIGTGKLGPKLTIDSIQTPYKGRIQSSGSTLFTFSTNSDGLYQIIETDAVSDPKKIRVPFYAYAAADGKASITLAGSSFTAESYLKLSSGEGAKKIWVVFRDKNYHYDYNFVTLTVDDTAPFITATTPANGDTAVSTAPKITIQFDNDVDVTNLKIDFRKSGTIVPISLTSLSEESTSSKAVYQASGFVKSVTGTPSTYSATVSTVTDIAGNSMSAYSFSFTIAYYFALSFDSQSGSAISNQDVQAGYRAAKPVDPTRTGYTFAGWYKESSCTNAWDFNNDTINSNTILYAKWIINTYNVTFDTQGGSPVSSQSIIYTNKITEPTTPVKAGYSFYEWYKESGCINKWTFPSDTMPASNITLYAKWVKQYTVNFDSTGGTSVTSQIIDSGLKASEPTAPTRSGFDFKGWFKDSSYTNAWTFLSDIVSSDTVLYAKWTVKVHIITFNSHNGSAVASQSVLHNGLVTQPANPTCGSIAFLGWYDKTFTTPWNFSTDVVTGDTTIWAKWNFAVGQTYCGGIIFDVDATGQHGLIASSADQNPALSFGVSWNTANSLCSSYTTSDTYGTYSGWRLATLSELNTLYAQKNVVGSSSFLTGRMYWSSTPQPSTNYWYIRFDDGYQGNTLASNEYATISYVNYDCRARAVKTF